MTAYVNTCNFTVNRSSVKRDWDQNMTHCYCGQIYIRYWSAQPADIDQHNLEIFWTFIGSSLRHFAKCVRHEIVIETDKFVDDNGKRRTTTVLVSAVQGLTKYAMWQNRSLYAQGLIIRYIHKLFLATTVIWCLLFFALYDFSCIFRYCALAGEHIFTKLLRLLSKNFIATTDLLGAHKYDQRSYCLFCFQ